MALGGGSTAGSPRVGCGPLLLWPHPRSAGTQRLSKDPPRFSCAVHAAAKGTLTSSPQAQTRCLLSRVTRAAAPVKKGSSLALGLYVTFGCSSEVAMPAEGARQYRCGAALAIHGWREQHMHPQHTVCNHDTSNTRTCTVQVEPGCWCLTCSTKLPRPCPCADLPLIMDGNMMGIYALQLF
jgi:hypothetical protein